MTDRHERPGAAAACFHALAACVLCMVLILPVPALGAMIPAFPNMAESLLGRLGVEPSEALFTLLWSGCVTVLTGAQAFICFALARLHPRRAWEKSSNAAGTAFTFATVMTGIPIIPAALMVARGPAGGGILLLTAACGVIALVFAVAGLRDYVALSRFVADDCESTGLRRAADIPGRCGVAFGLCILIGFVVVSICVVLVDQLPGWITWGMPFTGFVVLVGIPGAALAATAAMLFRTGLTLSRQRDP